MFYSRLNLQFYSLRKICVLYLLCELKRGGSEKDPQRDGVECWKEIFGRSGTCKGDDLCKYSSLRRGDICIGDMEIG